MIYRIHILVLFLLLFYYTAHPVPAETPKLKAMLPITVAHTRPNSGEGKSCLSVSQAHIYAGAWGAAMGTASAKHGSLHQLK